MRKQAKQTTLRSIIFVAVCLPHTHSPQINQKNTTKLAFCDHFLYIMMTAHDFHAGYPEKHTVYSYIMAKMTCCIVQLPMPVPVIRPQVPDLTLKKIDSAKSNGNTGKSIRSIMDGTNGLIEKWWINNGEVMGRYKKGEFWALESIRAAALVVQRVWN